MIVLINDVGSAHKINECSDSYSIVGGVRIVKIILHTYLLISSEIIKRIMRLHLTILIQ